MAEMSSLEVTVLQTVLSPAPEGATQCMEVKIYTVCQHLVGIHVVPHFVKASSINISTVNSDLS